MESEEPEIKSKQASERDRTLNKRRQCALQGPFVATMHQCLCHVALLHNGLENLLQKVDLESIINLKLRALSENRPAILCPFAPTLR